ncbi:MAG: ribosomal L7Ae/L30e/S12e/Gadd45 family protein [Lachnospiraceae bacterium]|nr:ribosomal L7Ae/L30e/S12e/Gadd45 family protein [Lachnospiraceae bacterium]
MRHLKKDDGSFKRPPEEISKKVLSLLGLSTKAGFAASGEFLTEKSVKDGKARLVIVAGDASDNTKKKFKDMCDYYGVPCFSFSDKDTLGHSMGKEFRASLAVNDQGMAAQIIKYLESL